MNYKNQGKLCAERDTKKKEKRKQRIIMLKKMMEKESRYHK